MAGAPVLSRLPSVDMPVSGALASSVPAAELATGEFVAFMDNDDTLAPDALLHYVRRLQQYPETDIFYSDEDKIDADDRRYDPQTSILQALFMMNGKFMSDRTKAEFNEDITTLVKEEQPNERKLRSMFYLLLSRPPRADASSAENFPSYCG